MTYIPGGVADNAITFPKIQDIATDRLLGRDTAGTGDPEEIALAGSLVFTGSTSIQLNGDSGSPGNSKYYGTDGGGTKGFFDLPSGSLSDGDKGDITVSASGATWTIDNDVITFAKFQNIATDRLLGRDTASSGDPEEIALAGSLVFTGSQSVQLSGDSATPGNSKYYGTDGGGAKGFFDLPSGTLSDGDKGDITVSASGAAWTIDNDVVTFAKMQNIATDRLLGRDTTASGDVEEIALAGSLVFTGSTSIQLSGDNATPGNSKYYGTDSGGTKGFFDLPSGTLSDGDKGDITVSGSGATWTIDNDVVTFAKMQNIATDKLIGRDTAASGDPEEIGLAGSLVFTGSASIQLSGDSGSPGNSKYYGTNGGGAKGFYDLPAGGTPEMFDHVSKSADYTVQAPDDKGKTFVCTNTITLTLPSASSKFWFSVINAGDGLVKIGTLIRLLPNEWARIASDGSSFFVLDVRLYYDQESSHRPPLTSHSEDDEFNGTTVDAAWTASTDGTETPTTDQDTTVRSHYWINWAGTGGATSSRRLQKSCGAGTSTMSLTARARLPIYASTMHFYLTAADSNGIGGSDYVQLQYRRDGASAFPRFILRNRTASANSDTSTEFTNFNAVGQDMILHLQRNASNSWAGWVSMDGKTWVRIATVTRSITVATAGITLGPSPQSGTTPIQCGCDWFRRDWKTL